MNENEWFKKADDDLKMAEVIIQSNNPPAWGVCYHSQQAVEKYLKAYLVANNIEFKEIHDLMYLFDLCLSKDADFKNIKEELKILNPYSITTRYPFVNTREYTIEEAKSSIERTEKVKNFIIAKLDR